MKKLSDIRDELILKERKAVGKRERDMDEAKAYLMGYVNGVLDMFNGVEAKEDDRRRATDT